MKDVKDLSQLIATKGEKPIIISTVNQQPEEDAKLERKLRELKFRQELRKDWILFIIRDLVIFSAIIFFLLAVSGYSLFMHIYR
jgi:hypothetical protein